MWQLPEIFMSPLKKALFVESQPVYGGFWRKKSSLNHHIWISPIKNNLLSVESFIPEIKIVLGNRLRHFLIE